MLGASWLKAESAINFALEPTQISKSTKLPAILPASLCASIVYLPSSSISPKTAILRVLGKSLSVSSAKWVDKGEALYVSSIMVEFLNPFNIFNRPFGPWYSESASLISTRFITKTAPTAPAAAGAQTLDLAQQTTN